MKTPDHQPKKKVSFSDWLELLQQESWQLELLVSGFALFGIWESRQMLNNFAGYMSAHDPVDFSTAFVLKGLSLLLSGGWGIFFINLLIHVVLRGLWIGAIGLRYVSGEINYQTLDYHEKFESYLTRRVGRFDHYIERLEKVCSVIFAYTFLLFFIFISAVMILIHLVILGQIAGYLSDWGWGNAGIACFVIYFLLGFIVLIDFFSGGSIKKVRSKTFTTVYLLIYRFYSFTTLSFLYRPLLYNFFDYKYTRRLFWFSLPYVFLVFIFFPGFNIENTEYFPDYDNIGGYYFNPSEEIIKPFYYDDLRYQQYDKKEYFARKAIRNFSLSSSEIEHSSGKIFFPFHKEDAGLLQYKYRITPLNEQGLQHSFFNYRIKDSVVTNILKEKSMALLTVKKARKEAIKSGTLKVEETDTEDDDGVKGFMQGLDARNYGRVERIPGNMYEEQLDSIEDHYEALRDGYVNGKMLAIKNALVDANQIYINDVNYQERLTCKFYTHPNLKEKGILCYFPTDSLPDGEHILRWERKTYNPRKLDSIRIINRSVPFWTRSKR